MLEPILLTTARIATFAGQRFLTSATCFFFKREERLFVVTSRHVMIDELNGHKPDRVEIELHSNPDNLAQAFWFSIPLYKGGKPLWRQGIDRGGEVDVAAIELDRTALPDKSLYAAFGPEHLADPYEPVEVGSSVLMVGFPLGFHDSLHHLPVVRHAVLASSFNYRFKGQGYFLTDARTHRGTSGSPVVMRRPKGTTQDEHLPWRLLGVHSARLDVGPRDLNLDEALGLNCVWHADILITLTEN